jgi:hypothetical protein
MHSEEHGIRLEGGRYGMLARFVCADCENGQLHSFTLYGGIEFRTSQPGAGSNQREAEWP